MSKSTKNCAGCYYDFYNTERGGCWSLAASKMVTRYKIGWWTDPTVPGAFTKVRVRDCFHQPGGCAHYKKLPSCAVSAPVPVAEVEGRVCE